MHALRVESPPEWRWGTADAAFLARLLQRLGGSPASLAVDGLPPDLRTLLALAKPSARNRQALFGGRCLRLQLV